MKVNKRQLRKLITETLLKEMKVPYASIEAEKWGERARGINDPELVQKIRGIEGAGDENLASAKSLSQAIGSRWEGDENPTYGSDVKIDISDLLSEIDWLEAVIFEASSKWFPDLSLTEILRQKEIIATFLEAIKKLDKNAPHQINMFISSPNYVYDQLSADYMKPTAKRLHDMLLKLKAKGKILKGLNEV
jgi:hypothetical protein